MHPLDPEIRFHFPDLEPADSPPRPWHLGPIGCIFTGAGPVEPKTRSYLTNYCFALFRIPIFVLATYRVVGYAFDPQVLGRTPVSLGSQLWNCGLVVAALLAIVVPSYVLYTSSPEYQAGVRMAAADRKADSGDLSGAIAMYVDLAQSHTTQAPLAAAKLRELLDGPVAEREPRLAVQLLNAAFSLRSRGRGLSDAEFFARGTVLFEKHALAEPELWLGQLRLLADVVPDGKEKAEKLRRQLLEQLAAQKEPNLDYMSQLAELLESEKDLVRLEQLLAPHAARLGSREGARMLGAIYQQQGKLDESHAVLLPYVEKRLVDLHNNEKAFEETAKDVEARLIDWLRRGQGPPAFYASYDAANEQRKQELVTEILTERMKDDPALALARDNLRKAANVAPVALDLGLVMLRRGQTIPDPAARKAELERAEKMFLAIGGVAGESEEYQLSLGQVYYWLGKHAEGKKEFDKVLERKQRDALTLVAVAAMLRDVGSFSEARPLTEEAFQKGASEEEKQGAAQMRSLLAIDLDDRITWLERCNQNRFETKASLASSKGQKAWQAGDAAEAERQYREAIALYAKQPESAAVLNNQALVLFNLYAITGERADFERGVEQLERALTLQPTDSVLLRNAASAILAAALHDLAKEQIDMKIARGIDFSELAFLYHDRAGREALTAKMRAHPGLMKAKDLLQRGVLLAPKNVDSYRTLLELGVWLEDEKLLAELLTRLEGVKLDLGDQIAQFRRGVEEGLDPADKQRLVEAMAQMDKRLPEAQASALPTTYSLAASRSTLAKLALTAIERDTELDDSVKLAEKLYQEHPSRGTARLLRGALLMRTHQRMKQEEPTYAILEQKLGGLAGIYILPWALEKNETLRAKILADPDIVRWQAFTLERMQDDPLAAGTWEWAFFRYALPEKAAEIVAAERKTPTRGLERKIEGRLSPWQVGHLLDSAWGAQMTGDDAAQEAAQQALADAGIE